MAYGREERFYNPRRDAGTVRNADEAARLRDELRRDLNQRTQATPEWKRDALAAIDALERGWPEIKSRGFGEGRPEGLGRRDRQYQRSGRATTRSGRNRPHRNRPTPAPRRHGDRSGRASAAGLGYLFGRGAGRRALRETGLPGAAESTTAVVLRFLGWGIGLAALYRGLTAGEGKRGKSPMEAASKGLVDALRALMSPAVDLLGQGPTVPTRAGSPAPSSPAPTPADTGGTPAPGSRPPARHHGKRHHGAATGASAGGARSGPAIPAL